jgi:hypothetical protein
MAILARVQPGLSFSGNEQIYAKRIVSLIYAFAQHPAPLNAKSEEPIWSETDRGWLRRFPIAFREYGLGK